MLKRKHTIIVDTFEYNSRKIVCHIYVRPRNIKYYAGDSGRQTFHWITTEDWAEFDENLECILSKYDWSDRKNLNERFLIRPAVNVRIENTRTNKKQGNANVALDLNALFEYSNCNKWESKTKKIAELIDDVPNNDAEYEPTTENDQYTVESSKYVPYIPSPKKELDVRLSYEPTSVNELSSNVHEEPYLPQPIVNTDTVPLYKPKRIKQVSADTAESTKKKAQPEEAGSLLECETETNTLEMRYYKLCKHGAKTKSKKPFGKQTSDSDEKIHLISNVDCVENQVDKQKLNCSLSSEGSVIDFQTIDKQRELAVQEEATRRSGRPPIRTNRYQDFECSKLCKNNAKSKTSVKSSQSVKFKTSLQKMELERNLFGSDDDDGHTFAESKPESTANDSQSAKKVDVNVTKKKRKRNRSDDKNVSLIETWLQKKSTTKKKSENVTEVEKDKYKSNRKNGALAEQLEQQSEEIKQAHQVCMFLEKFNGPPPEKVEFLTLDSMPEDKLLGTFERYKSRLDFVFNKCKMKSIVLNFEGVDHCFVMSLLDYNKRLKLMDRLSAVYEHNLDPSSAYTQLFANAMMPEWIMCIFMNKYKLSREKAIAHIKAQERYRVYTNDNADISLEL